MPWYGFFDSTLKGIEPPRFQGRTKLPMSLDIQSSIMFVIDWYMSFIPTPLRVGDFHIPWLFSDASNADDRNGHSQ